MPKRQISGASEQAHPRKPRKKQAVTATRSAATKAMYVTWLCERPLTDDQSIQRNALTSPLLKLPGEIREKIFSLVVGHQLIHLLYFPTLEKFRHTICTAAASEDEAYEEFMNGHTPSGGSAVFHSVTFKKRHVYCKSWVNENEHFLHADYRSLSRLMTMEERRKPTLNLSILGACRQMYEEANVLLWTTNTFSFEDPPTLRVFIDGLHSTQRNKLSRIHIDFEGLSFSAFEWEQALRPSFLSKLKGLRTLHATFDEFSKHYYGSITPTPMSLMQILPLQHVTVFIGNIFKRVISEHDTWTLTQQREAAEALRNKLLNPDGREVLAAEIKAEEAIHKAQQEEEQAQKMARRARREERERAREAEHQAVLQKCGHRLLGGSTTV